MRTESPSDLVVPVEGVGEFRFAQKNLRIQMEIEAEYCRLTEGIDLVTTYFGNLASAMAELRVLLVKGPDAWDLDAMDPEESDTYAKIFKVWGALRDKQQSFRKRSTTAG
jgi:hypothetical protein